MVLLRAEAGGMSSVSHDYPARIAATAVFSPQFISVGLSVARSR
jgi:hypothetical protein